VTLRVDTALDAEAIVQRAAEAGVGVAATRVCYMGPAPHAELVLGYADLDEALIREGVRRLAVAIGTA
jgi:GntR family transcriptional regulator/MocR family aminotransferase